MCVVLVNAAHTPGRYLREGWRVSNPQRDEVALYPVGPGGGSRIWGQARGGWRSAPLAPWAAGQGVVLLPGVLFFASWKS